jgi:hypothetical protein
MDQTCPSPEKVLDSPPRGGIPEDFATAAVVRCRQDVQEFPGEGTWTVMITERADTPASDLIAELRQPSDTPSGDPCPAIAVFAPYFLLVDGAGRALLPAVPTDACGLPRQEVQKALDALSYTEVSRARVGQSQSQRSAETGCPDAYKDMITITEGTPAPARDLWPPDVATVGVCVYAVADSVSGRLETGLVLRGPLATALGEALNEAGEAAPCTSPHTRFAVLTPSPQAAETFLELDGCRRVLRPDNTLGQVDQQTIGLLTPN